MKTPFAVFLGLSLLSAGTPIARAQTNPSADAVLEKICQRTGVPGIAAAVVREGKIIAAGVSGFREIGKPDAINLGDSFIVGSCTKPMTRLLLGRLAQAGKVRLDATLPQLLPGVKMRPEYEKITLADLINHTAGLPAYTRITPQDTPIVFELKGPPMEQRNRFVEHLLMEKPVGTVGKDFVYSNAGFVVIGNIIERAAGQPWEKLIQEEVFQPLGIRSATIGMPKDAANVLPKGHERTPKGYALAAYSPPPDGFLAPAGGVCLSIEDFARFAAAEVRVDAGIDTPFLTKDTATALPALQPAGAPRGESLTLHGGQGTFTAALALWPAKGLGIVVSVNGGDATAVCDETIEALRAAFAPDAAASGPKMGVMLRAAPNGSVVIESVVPGGLADTAGIKAGDEIVSLDGKVLTAGDPNTLGAALRAPGVKIGLRRAGKILEIQMPASGPTPPKTKN